MRVPIAGTTARRLVHFKTIWSVNEGAMRYPVFKACLYAGVELVTLTFDLEMVFGDFYTELGS